MVIIFFLSRRVVCFLLPCPRSKSQGSQSYPYTQESLLFFVFFLNHARGVATHSLSITCSSTINRLMVESADDSHARSAVPFRGDDELSINSCKTPFKLSISSTNLITPRASNVRTRSRVSFSSSSVFPSTTLLRIQMYGDGGCSNANMAESKKPGCIQISYAEHSASRRGRHCSESAGKVAIDDCGVLMQSLHWTITVPC